LTEPILSAGGLARRLGAAGHGFTLRVGELSLAPGQCIAVTGPSGCGKSTLLGLLGLALRPDEGGRLRLGAIDALALWRRGDADALAAARARMIGFVPQTSGLITFLTLADNIALPLAMLGRSDAGRTRTLAEQLGIQGELARRPAEVSVGQRQRAALARALVHRPPIILADEPTAALHPAQASEIFALLRRVAADGAAVLVCTHDLAEAASAGFTMVACLPDADGGGAHVNLATPAELAA
jgi:putative ABC transport system ATP-binding protein